MLSLVIHFGQRHVERANGPAPAGSNACCAVPWSPRVFLRVPSRHDLRGFRRDVLVHAAAVGDHSVGLHVQFGELGVKEEERPPAILCFQFAIRVPHIDRLALEPHAEFRLEECGNPRSTEKEGASTRRIGFQ